MYCGEYTLVNRTDDAVHAVTLHCRAWSCETCGTRRRAALVEEAAAGKPNTLLTLTSPRGTVEGQPQRRRDLGRAWALMRKRAMRHYSLKELPFLAVVERTKAGEPHLHILLRVKWLDQAWLSEQMKGLNGAPIVDIRRITSTRMAINYVTKYIGKAPARFGRQKGYWSSRDWLLAKPRLDPLSALWRGPWSVVKHELHDYAHIAATLGFIVEWTGLDEWLGRYRPRWNTC